MRTTASAAHAPPVWASAPAPAAATAIGGDVPARGAILRLLAEEGFTPRPAVEADGLVVVLGHSREDARLRDIRGVAEAHPTASILVIMPVHVPNAALRRALLAGAHGIVMEGDVERALGATARAVLAGQLAVPTVLGQQIAPRPLSHREKQILALVVLGMTNREIANKLFLAESTVKTHLSSAFRKIDARSRSEAVARIQDPESQIGFGVMAVTAGVTG